MQTRAVNGHRLTQSYWKPVKGHRQTVQTEIRRHIMRRLSGSGLFAHRMSLPKIKLKRRNEPDTLKMTNGLVQHVTVEEFASIHILWQPVYHEMP